MFTLNPFPREQRIGLCQTEIEIYRRKDVLFWKSQHNDLTSGHNYYTLFRQLYRLIRCNVNFSDNDVLDLSDDDVDLSCNFVVICMLLTRHEHVLRVHFLTNE